MVSHEHCQMDEFRVRWVVVVVFINLYGGGLDDSHLRRTSIFPIREVHYSNCKCSKEAMMVW
jgi:hypothetical protein